MLSKILIYILIPALTWLTVPALPLIQPSSHSTGSAVTSQRGISGLIEAVVSGQSTKENSLFALNADAPAQVSAGDPFNVSLSLDAKVALSFGAIVVQLPSGVDLVSGNLQSFKQNFAANDTLTDDLQLKANQEGSYTITINARAKPTTGDSQALSIDLTIQAQPANTPPTASFTFSPQQPKSGQSVTFDASGSTDPDGTVASYSWNFGDGSNDSGANKVSVSHVFQKPGNYTVRLTVTDNSGATSQAATSTISVQQPPTIFQQIPLEVWIGLGVVVGGGLLYLLIRAITGGPSTPTASGSTSPPIASPSSSSSSSMENAIKGDAAQFILSSGLPFKGVTAVNVKATVQPLDRATWVQTLVDHSVIITGTQNGQLQYELYGQLSADQQQSLDLSPLQTPSLVDFISPQVSPGDQIVTLTWTMANGQTIQSLAVINSSGQLKFDTLMNLEPLANLSS